MNTVSQQYHPQQDFLKESLLNNEFITHQHHIPDEDLFKLPQMRERVIPNKYKGVFYDCVDGFKIVSVHCHAYCQ